MGGNSYSNVTAALAIQREVNIWEATHTAMQSQDLGTKGSKYMGGNSYINVITGPGDKGKYIGGNSYINVIIGPVNICESNSCINAIISTWGHKVK